MRRREEQSREKGTVYSDYIEFTYANTFKTQSTHINIYFFKNDI